MIMMVGARSVSRYWIKTLERSFGRSVGTDLICQSRRAVDGDDWDARVMMLRRELSPPVSGSS